MVLFSEWQGYKSDKNILYQYNKSAIILEVGGKGFTSKSQGAE